MTNLELANKMVKYYDMSDVFNGELTEEDLRDSFVGILENKKEKGVLKCLFDFFKSYYTYEKRKNDKELEEVIAEIRKKI